MFRDLMTRLLAALQRKKTMHVVLKDERGEDGLRYLGASYAENGDLRIEGHDIGAQVDSIFGYREYEWIWTIARTDLTKLATALGTKSSLLDALKERFNGPAAAHLDTFLKEHHVPYEIWSRIGD